MSTQAQDIKGRSVALARLALRAFLDGDSTLDLTPAGTPRVSVVMLMCNRAELSLACVQSLLATGNRTPFELIVVDNGSSDETPELLRRLRGARVVRNPVNLGYPRAVNQGAALACGEYLLLLNNDTQVLGRSLDVGAAYLDAHPDVGAVGGRVILLDGTLQEAGCSVLRDGWTRQLGRGEPPDHPAHAFVREVDYCSGAFLMMRRRLFDELGRLDEAFSPGYFEDPDFSVRLWAAGWRFVYLPAVAVLHHETATHQALWDPGELCRRHHELFAGRHAGWLAAQLPPDCPPIWSRAAYDHSFKVLLVLGEPARADVLGLLARVQALDGFVTLCRLGAGPCGDPPLALPATVEAFSLETPADLEPFLAGRPGYYDLGVVRPALLAALGGGPHARLIPWATWDGYHLTLPERNALRLTR